MATQQYKTIFCLTFLASFGQLVEPRSPAAQIAQRPNYVTPAEFLIAQEAQAQELHLNFNKSLPIFNPPHNHVKIPQDAQYPTTRNSSSSRNAWKHTQWPSGRIPYTLDPSFNDAERIEVAKAINNYHTATCIRFTPRIGNEESWVDILRDDTTCGLAHVCRLNGGQFAKFGGGCINAGVMTHELGHTICFGHEQTRFDREDWITFNSAICSPHGIDREEDWSSLDLLYDYVSLQHYEGECYNGCMVPRMSGVTKCGSGGPLSVLDVEKINAYYQCPGCHSYRFRPSSKVTPEDDLVEAGYDLNSTPLVPCRTYHNGDIIPGKGRRDTQQCWVTHHRAEHAYAGVNVELLAQPSDAGARLVWRPKPAAGLPFPSNAVPGGRSAEREPLYIGRCNYTTNTGQTLLIPGKIHLSTSPNLYIGYGGAEHQCTDYEILQCE